MSMAFITIGGISLGCICYRFVARLYTRPVVSCSLEKKDNT